MAESSKCMYKGPVSVCLDALFAASFLYSELHTIRNVQYLT